MGGSSAGGGTSWCSHQKAWKVAVESSTLRLSSALSPDACSGGSSIPSATLDTIMPRRSQSSWVGLGLGLGLGLGGEARQLVRVRVRVRVRVGVRGLGLGLGGWGWGEGELLREADEEDSSIGSVEDLRGGRRWLRLGLGPGLR